MFTLRKTQLWAIVLLATFMGVAWTQETDKKKTEEKAPALDPAQVEVGMAAFQRSCTTCHDAARSLDRSNDLAGWRSVVRRMASKPNANIAQGDIEPIATYLASLNTRGGGASAVSDSGEEKTSLSAFATISPLFRDGDNTIQDPGFFPETWVGATWQGNVLSARVTACTACHGTTTRVEFVEAAVRVDFSQWLDKCCSGMKGSIDAGRIVVPFGAYSAQVNPGMYRTVTKPIIFDMGQRVLPTDIGEPVLPMPYADEGVNLNLSIPLADYVLNCCGTGPVTATVDGYLVNGLVGTDTGIAYSSSRDLYDNNQSAAGGGRLTVGGPNLRGGASITHGQFTAPAVMGASSPLDYTIYGFDVQARFLDLVRVQFEYARRDNDRSATGGGGIPGVPGGTTAGTIMERVAGCYVEAEVRPWENSRVSVLGRYDWQQRRSPSAPTGSTLTTGNFDVERFTWGVNFTLWRQSLLMVNHEIWYVPAPFNTVNVYGLRYAATF